MGCDCERCRFPLGELNVPIARIVDYVPIEAVDFEHEVAVCSGEVDDVAVEVLREVGFVDISHRAEILRHKTVAGILLHNLLTARLCAEVICGIR